LTFFSTPHAVKVPFFAFAKTVDVIGAAPPVFGFLVDRRVAGTGNPLAGTANAPAPPTSRGNELLTTLPGTVVPADAVNPVVTPTAAVPGPMMVVVVKRLVWDRWIDGGSCGGPGGAGRAGIAKISLRTGLPKFVVPVAVARRGVEVIVVVVSGSAGLVDFVDGSTIRRFRTGDFRRE